MAYVIKELPHTFTFNSEYNDTAYFFLGMNMIHETAYIEVTHNNVVKCNDTLVSGTSSAYFQCHFWIDKFDQVQTQVTQTGTTSNQPHAFIYNFLAPNYALPLQHLYSPYDQIKQNFPIMYKNEHSMCLDITRNEMVYMKIYVARNDSICLVVDPYIPYNREVFTMYSSKNFLPNPTKYEQKSQLHPLMGKTGISSMYLEEGTHIVLISGVNLTKTPVAGAYLVTFDGDTCFTSQSSLMNVFFWWIYLLVIVMLW
jgi:hypothetical protein